MAGRATLVIPPEPTFQESGWRSTPIRGLGLTIAGTQLEPLIAALLVELERA